MGWRGDDSIFSAIRSAFSSYANPVWLEQKQLVSLCVRTGHPSVHVSLYADFARVNPLESAVGYFFAGAVSLSVRYHAVRQVDCRTGSAQ